MKFEKYVPAAIIAAAMLGAWIDLRSEIGDVRREIGDVRREVSGLRAELFAVNGRVSHIEGLLTPRPQDSPATVAPDSAGAK